MLITATWRGWEGKTPPVQGVGARPTRSGVTIQYLFVHKYYRGRTIKAKVYKSLDEFEIVRLKWPKFRPADEAWGDIWKDVQLEYQENN